MAMRRATELVIGISILGALGCVVGLQRSSAAMGAKPERSDAAITALEERLARVEQEAAQPRRVGPATRPALLPAAEAREGQDVAANAPEDKAPPSRPTTPEEQKARATRFQNLLEDRFVGDTRDEVWSRGVESDLKSTVEATRATSMSDVERMECRGTMCRLSVRSANLDAQEQFMMSSAGKPGFRHAGASFRAYDERTGEVHTTVYLLRDEADLASLDPSGP